MKQYYLQAIKLKNSCTMYNLGCYYQTIEIDYDKMKQYYLQAIELNDSDAMHNLGEHYKSYELYIMLSQIKNKNNIINNKINELLNIHEINVLQNKINHSIKYKITHDCSICMENNKLNICFNCMHFVCIDCYVKMKVCPICRH